MQDYLGEVQINRIDLIDVLADIKLINVTEIKIIQEIVNFIDAHYQEHKTSISLAKVAALILNRDDIPNLYATSFRGYNNQVLEFQNYFGINGFKIRQKLIPWALDKVIREGLPNDLNQDLMMAVDSSRNKTPLNHENILEVLANINLASVTEFQVIQAAIKCVNTNYSEVGRKINLSDVCALVLNHDVVASLYATTEQEYNELTDTYIAEYQSKNHQIIRQVVDKIYNEGSENFFNHDSLVTVNFQRRKKLTRFWNIQSKNLCS